MSQKTKYVEESMRDVSLSMRSVIPLETSPPYSSLEMKQINSSTSFMLAASSLGNKTNLTLPILSQAKAITFILANLLQSQRI